MKKLLFTALLFATTLAHAQFINPFGNSLDIGIRLALDYDSPLGKIAFTHKSTIAPSLSLLLSRGDKMTANFTLGRSSYKPRASEFYYLVKDGEDFGIDTFTDFIITSAYMGFNYNFPIATNFKAHLGANLGAYFLDFTTTSQDYMQMSTAEVSEMDVYLAPKVGFSLELNEAFTIDFQAKFNIFSPTVKDSPTPSLNSRAGTIYNTWSSGLGISYQF